MNKIITTILLRGVALSIVMSLSSLSYALISPEEIQNNLGQTSSELLDQILEVNDGVGEIRTYEVFKSYFELLPFFEQKAIELNLDSVYPGVVAKLADTLAAHGMRWISVVESTPAEVLQIFRVMKPDTMNAFLYKLQTEMEVVGDDFNENDVAEKFRQMAAWIDQHYSDEREIGEKIDSLMSSLSEKVLTRDVVLTESELIFWIEGLQKTQFIESYLIHLHSMVLESQADQMNYLSLAALIFGNHLTTVDNLPNGILNGYANLFIELLGKALEAGVVISEDSLSNILSEFNAVNMQGLVYRLLNVKTIPQGDFVDTYLNVLNVVIAELLQRGLTGPAQELGRYVGARMAATIANAKGHEGTYRLRDEEGNSWVMTLVQSTEDRLIASLGLNDGIVFQSFFNIIYSVEMGKYLASEIIPDNGFYPNFPAEIDINAEGQVEVIMPFASSRLRKTLTGQKMEPYENYFNIQNMHANYISGEYRGEILLPGSRRPKQVSLFVQNFPEYSIGRLVLNDGAIFVELQHGTQGGLGFIYLTSGKLQSGSFFHLRLKQDVNNDEVLEGAIVIGGRGMSSSVRLEKVN